MDLPISFFTLPPVPDEIECDAVLIYQWLLETWFVRLRWIALPLCALAAPFVPGTPWPLPLTCPLALALGNGWIVWRLRRAAGGSCLRQVREVATGLDWALGLVALGVSTGTAAHEALPAVLLLLTLSTALRYGLNGLLGATVASACLTALLVALHVVLIRVLLWQTAAEVLAGWEVLIVLTALLCWGLLGARDEWYRRETARLVRRGTADRLESGLTKREWELLPMLAREELTYAAIADRLNIGEETVKTHAHHLGAKLGATKRREIVAEARRRGLLPPRER